ncbi:MAG: S8 family serine peptidase [Deltaproteobacteria bacterium]|nr:S8 family serine peptidase [Deltaproteobacteria bacterium]
MQKFLTPLLALALVLFQAGAAFSSGGGLQDVIIRLERPPDVFKALPGPAGKEERKRMTAALKAFAGERQKNLIPFLRRRGAKNVKSLWMINAVSALVPPEAIPSIEAMPGVLSVSPNETVTLAPEPPEPLEPLPRAYPLALSAASWNVAATGAPDLWSKGFFGQKVVVATMDSGVDMGHPDLSGKWRGGTNSWFDVHGVYSTPHDDSGHGTRVMGVICGGDQSGMTLGMAPQSEWIAVRIFDGPTATTWADIHAGFQWLLDPDGNPATDDAPDVVNNSWGFPEQVDQCITEFSLDIQLLKAAGISVVFSAGNEGPSSSTSVSPGNAAGGFAVGAVDRYGNVAYFSSRGPTPCVTPDLYPLLVAPGVSVSTTDLSLSSSSPSYVQATGTSFSAAHTSGAMALLLSAFPGLSPADLQNALTDSAVDLGAAGPDYDYGNGALDVSAAYDGLVLSGLSPCNPPAITITQSAGAVVGRPAHFASEVSGGTPPYSYDWDVDGIPGTDCVTAGCDFSYPDFYEGPVTLCVTDANGCSACASVNVVAGLEVSGTVQNLSGGAAPGVSVSWEARPDLPVTSDANGNYALGGVPPGEQIHLVCQDPTKGNFAPSHSAFFTTGATNLVFDPAAAPVDLETAAQAACATLPGQALVLGVVRDLAGDAASGVKVTAKLSSGQAITGRVLYLDASGAEIPGAQTTDETGRFAICGQDASTGPLTLAAEKEGVVLSTASIPLASRPTDAEVTAVILSELPPAPVPALSDGGGGGCFLKSLSD